MTKTARETLQRLKAQGFEVSYRIYTAGDPYNAYSLYWSAEAWRGDDLVATAEHPELPDAIRILATRVE